MLADAIVIDSSLFWILAIIVMILLVIYLAKRI